MFTSNTLSSKSNSIINRFEEMRYIEYSPITKTYDPISSLFMRRLTKLKAKGTYKVTQNYGRPDLISFELYSTTLLCWVLLWYNDLRFFYEIKTGDVISYPDLKDLDGLTRALNVSYGMWV